MVRIAITAAALTPSPKTMPQAAKQFRYCAGAGAGADAGAGAIS